MSATTEHLNRAADTGQMDPFMVVPLFPLLAEHYGAAERDQVFRAAGLSDLPGDHSPVPQSQVLRLHQAIWHSWPEEAPRLFDQAGRVAGEVFVTHRITAKARALLQNMPWSVSAWLVGKSVRLNAGSFSGSGLFAIQTTGRFALFKNPIAEAHRSAVPGCHFHRAFLEHIFQRLSHRDFHCTEEQCCSTGAEACTFKIEL